MLGTLQGYSRESESKKNLIMTGRAFTIHLILMRRLVNQIFPQELVIQAVRQKARNLSTAYLSYKRRREQ